MYLPKRVPVSHSLTASFLCSPPPAPSAPLSVSVTDVRADSALLTWQFPADCNGFIDAFHVTLTRFNDTSSSQISSSITITQFNLTTPAYRLDNLVPSTQHSLSLSASTRPNAAGFAGAKGPDSQPALVFVTLPKAIGTCINLVDLPELGRNGLVECRHRKLEAAMTGRIVPIGRLLI
ncbi:unnamed protein product, partial [Protopolystoma xenopodis]